MRRLCGLRARRVRVQGGERRVFRPLSCWLQTSSFWLWNMVFCRAGEWSWWQAQEQKADWQQFYYLNAAEDVISMLGEALVSVGKGPWPSCVDCFPLFKCTRTSLRLSINTLIWNYCDCGTSETGKGPATVHFCLDSGSSGPPWQMADGGGKQLYRNRSPL